MSRSCRMDSPSAMRPVLSELLPFLTSSSPRMESLRLFLRFGVVGVLNTAFSYAVFVLLVVIGIWPGPALVLSAIASVAFNFQTSRRLVFQSGGRSIRFVALYGIVILTNWLGLHALSSVGVNELIGQAILAPPMAVFSFF